MAMRASSYGDRSDVTERVVSLNRVAKVEKGGRRFSFSALSVSGNKAGIVGYGFGKARQVPGAIEKAARDGRKHLMRIPLTRTWTRWYVPFSDLAQYGFGDPLVPLAKERLVSLIIWPEPQQVDIWIDDIRFEP